ncbi:MAG TPA: chitosanase [Kofleriaceae bacterium]|jgi:chitosanase
MRHLLPFLLLAACGGSSSSSGSDAGVDGSADAGPGGVTLATPVKKQIFLEMVNTAEQSALDWTQAYPYCEDIDDGRGYTTGIVGFTTDSAGATTDDGPGVLGVVTYYDGLAPGNALHKYLSALQMTASSGTGSHTKIDAVGNFCPDWTAAAADAKLQQAQQHDFDVTAFDPARELAIADGLGVLGQAFYVDDSILNGYGGDPSLTKDVQAAKAMAQPPAQGGDEKAYLTAFLAAYRASIIADAGHADDGSADRVDTMWGPLVTAGNFSLATPLHWTMYGDPFAIETDPTPDPALAQDW